MQVAFHDPSVESQIADALREPYPSWRERTNELQGPSVYVCAAGSSTSAEDLPSAEWMGDAFSRVAADAPIVPVLYVPTPQRLSFSPPAGWRLVNSPEAFLALLLQLHQLTVVFR